MCYSMSVCKPHKLTHAKGIPVAESSRIASAFQRDGASGRALAQMASSERERDFFRWLKLPIQPLMVDLPVWSNTKERKDRQLILEKTAVILPSDVLCELCKRSLLETCLIGHSHLGACLAVVCWVTYRSCGRAVHPLPRISGP